MLTNIWNLFLAGGIAIFVSVTGIYIGTKIMPIYFDKSYDLPQPVRAVPSPKADVEVVAPSPSPSPSPSPPPPPPPLTEAEKWRRSPISTKVLVIKSNVKIAKIEWTTGGFGSIAVMNFKIDNNGDHAFKDLTLNCQFSASSGTMLSNVEHTIYENFKPKSSRKLRDVNIGLIHNQSAGASCSIGGLVPID